MGNSNGWFRRVGPQRRWNEKNRSPVLGQDNCKVLREVPENHEIQGGRTPANGPDWETKGVCKTGATPGGTPELFLKSPPAQLSGNPEQSGSLKVQVNVGLPSKLSRETHLRFGLLWRVSLCPRLQPGDLDSTA